MVTLVSVKFDEAVAIGAVTAIVGVGTMISGVGVIEGAPVNSSPILLKIFSRMFPLVGVGVGIDSTVGTTVGRDVTVKDGRTVGEERFICICTTGVVVGVGVAEGISVGVEIVFVSYSAVTPRSCMSCVQSFSSFARKRSLPVAGKSAICAVISAALFQLFPPVQLVPFQYFHVWPSSSDS